MQCTACKASSLATRFVADSKLPITQHHRDDCVEPAICDKVLHGAARPIERPMRSPLRGEPGKGNLCTLLPVCRNLALPAILFRIRSALEREKETRIRLVVYV